MDVAPAQNSPKRARRRGIEMRVIGIILILVGFLAACLFVATVSGWLEHTRWDPVFLFVISAPAAVVGLALGFIFWIAGLIAGRKCKQD